MLEQEYLEMANQLKQKFEENEAKYNLIIQENIELKKMVFTAYGNVRMIDWLLQMEEEVGTELKITIENTRGLLSEFLGDLQNPHFIHISVEAPTSQSYRQRSPSASTAESP